MAKHVVTTTEITDDIDGSAGAETVTFAFQGVDYSIDLGKRNRSAMEKALKPYLASATKVPLRRSARRTSSPARKDLTAIREWAKAEGLKVSERGRISRTVVEQYDATH